MTKNDYNKIYREEIGRSPTGTELEHHFKNQTGEAHLRSWLKQNKAKLIKKQPEAKKTITTKPTPAKPKQKEQKSLIQIWNEREDLQREFPDPLGKGVSGNWTLNDWWNQYGVKEAPNVELVEPDIVPAMQPREGDTRINPQTGVQETYTPEGIWQSTAGAPSADITPTTADGIIDPSDPLAGLDTTGWSDVERDLYMQLTDQVEMLIEQGNMIHPDIVIDEATTAQFLEQAQTELGPYYRQLAEQTKGDLLRAYDYKIAVQEEREAELGRQYERGVEDIGEQAAERGLAFSGRRQRQEREFREEAQRALGAGRRGFEYETTGLGRTAERYLGSQALAGFKMPTMGKVPTVGARQFEFGVEGMPLYEISDGLMGELEKAKTVAEKQRVGELEEAERRKRHLEFYPT